MKQLTTIVAFLALSLNVLAGLDKEKVKDCNEADGKIVGEKCVFDEKIMKGDEVIKLVSKAIPYVKSDSDNGDTAVIDGNAMDCVAKWHTIGKQSWKPDHSDPIYGELVFVNNDPERKYKTAAQEGRSVDACRAPFKPVFGLAKTTPIKPNKKI